MTDFNLADVVNELPQDTMTRFVQSEGAIIKGVRRAGGFTSSAITGHVQPTTPKELQHIEGGENVEEAITIYTTSVLHTTDDIQSHGADEIGYRNQRYKVISAADWSGQGFRTFIAGLIRSEPEAL